MKPDKRWNIEKLTSAGVSTVKELTKLEASRTTLLQELALTLVLLRAKHTHQGKPDYAGRSAEYRAVAASIYEQAGVPADSASTIQASVRYHIGNVLRETFAEDKLTAAGLKAASPRERANGRSKASEPAAASETPRVDVRTAQERIWDAFRVLEQIDPEDCDPGCYAALLELEVLVVRLAGSMRLAVEHSLVA